MERLEGGNAAGAVRIGDTVRRPIGPWTPSVHALLAHLEDKDFPGAPRVRGIDAEGREVLTFLDGETIGDRKPWPRWVHAEETLDQVATWLRAYHEAVADFVPPDAAMWRYNRKWRPGLIVAHNDAAPYNAAWRDDRLAGFFDWDFAGPVSRAADLAFVAFSWVPLHARQVVAAEGFTDFAGRRRRLERFLRSYGSPWELAEIVEIMRQQIRAHADDIAAGGDPLSVKMAGQGVADNLNQAMAELDQL
ncbi:phosphotransferase [Fodinicola acaciae]|uniref:phosphotransferase n=1 Tax=Fodinicola acaciae TaxID=2681555 RepID=UPI0013D1DA6E|nr:phosphotransferase [Fodinicola acaciae]